MNNLAFKAQPDADMSKITAMIMRLFEHWHLTYEQQAAVLGLSTNTHSTVARYKSGKTLLSKNRDSQDRAGHLLAIHKYLRLIFPLNPQLAYAWPKTPNKFFEGKMPLEIIITEGFLGLVRIRRYLESYVAA